MASATTPQFSFEFFPPKSDSGREKLLTTRDQLAKLAPAYVSVTFGAGGSTREGTERTVADMQAGGLNAAPHLSCIGSSRDEIRALLQRYQAMGVTRLVALRGDMPSGMRDSGDLHYANELVAFIRAETGDQFHIEVAAYPEFHPQAKSAADDLRHFRNKVAAGANAAITQYFYNPDAYFRFLDDCHQLNIEVPIIPGIMPIINYRQLARFSTACGAEIPRWLHWRMAQYDDDPASMKALGHAVVLDLCQRLLAGGAPGLHFYSMNQSAPITALWRDLGLSAAT